MPVYLGEKRIAGAYVGGKKLDHLMLGGHQYNFYNPVVLNGGRNLSAESQSRGKIFDVSFTVTPISDIQDFTYEFDGGIDNVVLYDVNLAKLTVTLEYD